MAEKQEKPWLYGDVVSWRNRLASPEKKFDIFLDF